MDGLENNRDVSDVKIYSLTSSRNVADGTKNKLPVTARL